MNKVNIISSVSVHSGRASNIKIEDLISQCMPNQGCIEIQNDVHGKEHAWHSHETDETIVILDGSLLFFWEGGEAVCMTGDVIELPRGVRHGSRAIDGDVRYLITFHKVEITT